jgi:hypothetical protein
MRITLCVFPRAKYIEIFGMKPNTSVTSPLVKGNHPESDTSELCSMDQIAQYQSMIIALQWIVMIGRFTIHSAVMTQCLDLGWYQGLDASI